jgi:hypothetical protein
VYVHCAVFVLTRRKSSGKCVLDWSRTGVLQSSLVFHNFFFIIILHVECKTGLNNFKFKFDLNIIKIKKKEKKKNSNLFLMYALIF